MINNTKKLKYSRNNFLVKLSSPVGCPLMITCNGLSFEIWYSHQKYNRHSLFCINSNSHLRFKETDLFKFHWGFIFLTIIINGKIITSACCTSSLLKVFDLISFNPDNKSTWLVLSCTFYCANWRHYSTEMLSNLPNFRQLAVSWARVQTQACLTPTLCCIQYVVLIFKFHINL